MKEEEVSKEKNELSSISAEIWLIEWQVTSLG